MVRHPVLGETSEGSLQIWRFVLLGELEREEEQLSPLIPVLHDAGLLEAEQHTLEVPLGATGLTVQLIELAEDFDGVLVDGGQPHEQDVAVHDVELARVSRCPVAVLDHVDRQLQAVHQRVEHVERGD